MARNTELERDRLAQLGVNCAADFPDEAGGQNPDKVRRILELAVFGTASWKETARQLGYTGSSTAQSKARQAIGRLRRLHKLKVGDRVEHWRVSTGERFFDGRALVEQLKKDDDGITYATVCLDNGQKIDLPAWRLVRCISD